MRFSSVGIALIPFNADVKVHGMVQGYSSKDFNHHGIVSVICDEINLVKTVDAIIPVDSRATMTVGESVKLMVINGLGFTSRPLYLQSQFFESKPINRLLGRQLESEQITDDRLGRSLDACYAYGCDRLFAEIATRAATVYNVDRKYQHLDTTSISVEGEYSTEDGLGLVQFGHSKDQRPDLKQFMISLVSSKDADVPLLAQTIAGNTSDKRHFRDVLSGLKKQIDPKTASYYVADSALYTKENISDLSKDILWITRVPEVLKDAKQLVREISCNDMNEVGNGYWIKEVQSDYAGVAQRWVLVFSEAAKTCEEKTLNRYIKKEFTEMSKLLRRVSKEQFGCKDDAKKALSGFEKKLRYHRCVNSEIKEVRTKLGAGRPKKDQTIEVSYQIKTSLERNEEAIEEKLEEKGKFIIATNELSKEHLTAVDLLEVYKGQQSVERGFRFLKDPLFLASSVFLKKQERIVALSMVMCLCLLVYTLAQRLIRLRIKELNRSVLDQRNKATTRPTMRWVFQVFEGVHLLLIDVGKKTQEQVLNLNQERLNILGILGPKFEKIYENNF